MHFCLALVYTPPNDALLRFQVGRSDSGHFLPDEVFQRPVVLERSGALNDGQTGVRHGECGGVGDRAEQMRVRDAILNTSYLQVTRALRSPGQSRRALKNKVSAFYSASAFHFDSIYQQVFS